MDLSRVLRNRRNHCRNAIDGLAMLLSYLTRSATVVEQGAGVTNAQRSLLPKTGGLSECCYCHLADRLTKRFDAVLIQALQPKVIISAAAHQALLGRAPSSSG